MPSRPRVISGPLGRGARRWAACTLRASLGPGGLPWRALRRFEVAASWLLSRYRFQPIQSQAGRYCRNPRNLNETVSRFSRVCSSACSISNLAWPPRTSTPSHVQQLSRVELFLSSVPPCSAACVCFRITTGISDKYCDTIDSDSGIKQLNHHGVIPEEPIAT